MLNKHFCRNCKGLRRHSILYEKQLENEGVYGFQFTDRYLVIECKGCDTISFLNIYGDITMYVQDENDGSQQFYDDETIYPPYLDHGHELVETWHLPDSIKTIYLETIKAFKSKCFLLTAGGFRTTIEAICNHLKIKAGSLSKRIDLLSEKGILSVKESRRLHSIRFIGNDALHEIEIPGAEQLYIVLNVVNHILENLFIQDKVIKQGLHSVVDEYPDFLMLIANQISKDMVGQTRTIYQILGRSIRLIKNETILKEFEIMLKQDVKAIKIDYLSTQSEIGQTVYQIEKLPKAIWNFK